MAHDDPQTPAGATTPRPPRTFGKHTCLKCGKAFVAKHNRQTKYCDEHKGTRNAIREHDRDKARGRLMVKLVQVWRMGRNTKDPLKRKLAAYALQELCALGDLYNREDAAEGRPAVSEAVRQMWAEGYRPSMDGRRRKRK